MRTGFFILCSVTLCVNAVAQRKDSVVLRPVTVYGLSEEKYLAGSMLHSLDSALKDANASRHLGEVLALQFPLYFRNYGSGMLSGVSMRGTSPQHTAVLWNGININSFSLGQADFSILPVTAADEIKVHEGGGSARYGSGAFGGTILLNSRPATTSSLSFTQEAGSFGRYFTSLNGVVAAGRWVFQTRMYHLTSQNNFKISSTGERQQHAGFRQSGILQSVSYQWSSARSLRVNYWYHDADRNIQPGISQVNAHDQQQDRNHRLSIQFQNRNRFGQSTVHGGLVRDVIIFNGGKSTVARSIMGVREEFVVAGSLHVQAGAEWNHISGKLKEWQNGHATESRFDFTASLHRNFGKRLSGALNFRQPFVPGFQAPFLPYAGAEYGIIQKSSSAVKLRASISKNYRIPTLNDRYWQNAGDRSLLPETSRGGESGIVWTIRQLQLSGTFFTQTVDEWIQWVPQENGNYRPRNIKQVWSQGLEFSAGGDWKLGIILFHSRLVYQYTSATTTRSGSTDAFTVGKQLAYTPTHIGSGFSTVSIGSWSGSAAMQYSGKRFTESSGSDAYALEPYALVDLSVGKKLSFGRHFLTLEFAARNILNHDYQMYAGKAMPGRSFNLQIMYQLKSNPQ